MIAEADDFLAETEALHALIAPIAEAERHRPTQFKGWSITHIIQHLHHFNLLAGQSLTEPDVFAQNYAAVRARREAGMGVVGATADLLDDLSGEVLLAVWLTGARKLADAFRDADPKIRVAWAGPTMSARSSISARLMETWAHGQELYDLLGIDRPATVRIRSIVVMGVNTYDWTFANRGEAVPEPKPYVDLVAPDGGSWTFGQAREDERIAGPAEAFAKVVTQVRNVADTPLAVRGPNASRWMAIAQCFAGPPNDPPPPGTRGPGAPPYDGPAP